MARPGNRRRRAPFHPPPKLDQQQQQPSSDPQQSTTADSSLNENQNQNQSQAQAQGQHSQSQSQSSSSNRRFDSSDRRGGDRRRDGRFQNNDKRFDRQHHHHHHQQQQHQQSHDADGNLNRGKGPEYTAYMASRAKELKEEGNRLFQKKDYAAAMEQYDLALKLTPMGHPDRAVFHSNRAACLMQMKPIHYDEAISECNLALQVYPGFNRALLRRARAFEATGKLDMAFQDVQTLLQIDPNHPDAIEMARRVRVSMGNQAEEAQQDLQGRPSTPVPSQSRDFMARPATPVSASVDESSSRDPCLTPQSTMIPTEDASSERDRLEVNNNGATAIPLPHPASSGLIQDMTPEQVTPQPVTPIHQMQIPVQQTPVPMQAIPQMQIPAYQTPILMQQTPVQAQQMPVYTMQMPTHVVHDPIQQQQISVSAQMATPSSERVIHQDNNVQMAQYDSPAVVQMRPLKLIYDHDIRLAEIASNCKFSDLRKLVKSKFPSAKSILVKYKDVEGDLVTITCTKELRLAEVSAALEVANRMHVRTPSMTHMGSPLDRNDNSATGVPVMCPPLPQLRLHIVEVPAEQEPWDNEEMSAMDVQESSEVGDSSEASQAKDTGKCKGGKGRGTEDMDAWLMDFAHLFKSHLGIDPNGHVDLHELGMELCAEALEEVATTEEAHKLFDSASAKFQEMIALGYLNWGNVFMCSARKQLPHDTDDNEMDFCDKLQAAFDWAQDQYALAEKKFEQALKVKPDYCDAMLSLGQKDFESAKLHWTLAVAQQRDLNTWDSSEMIKLFRSAEDWMQKAEEILKKRDEQNTTTDLESKDAAAAHEHDVALKSQIYLFWGNLLYEHSQVEFRLGIPSWKELLDASVQKFEVAGAPKSDIYTALQRHLSSSSFFHEHQSPASNNEEENGNLNNSSMDNNKAELNDKNHDVSIDEAQGKYENDIPEIVNKGCGSEENGVSENNVKVMTELNGSRNGDTNIASQKCNEAVEVLQKKELLTVVADEKSEHPDEIQSEQTITESTTVASE